MDKNLLNTFVLLFIGLKLSSYPSNYVQCRIHWLGAMTNRFTDRTSAKLFICHCLVYPWIAKTVIPE